jgi:hypothetical protein
MGFTVSSAASLYFNMYSLNNSDTYKDNTVDSSSVSKEKYKVSNLTNAFDALSNVDTANFSSISNVNSFARNTFKGSQLSNYDTLSNSTSIKNAKNLLSNKTDFSDLYHTLGSSAILRSTSKSVWSSYAANATAQTGSSNASEAGSIIDQMA